MRRSRSNDFIIQYTCIIKFNTCVQERIRKVPFYVWNSHTDIFDSFAVLKWELHEPLNANAQCKVVHVTFGPSHCCTSYIDRRTVSLSCQLGNVIQLFISYSKSHIRQNFQKSRVTRKYHFWPVTNEIAPFMSTECLLSLKKRLSCIIVPCKCISYVFSKTIQILIPD